MHIHTARTFIEIVDSGSFFKAAEKLHVTSSTVSMRINTLEESLGQKLFVRNRNGVKLTPAGIKFKKYALALLKTWQQAQNEIALPEGITAYIHLGVEHGFPPQMLREWLVHLRALAQNLAIGVEYHGAGELNQKVHSGQLDIALTYCPQTGPNADVHTLFEESLVLVSRNKRALMYWDPNYIYVDYGEPFKAWHNSAYPIDETPRLSLPSEALALDYLLHSGGSGHLRYSSCQALIERAELHLVEEAPSFSRKAYALCAKGVEEAPWFAVALSFFPPTSK